MFGCRTVAGNSQTRGCNGFRFGGRHHLVKHGGVITLVDVTICFISSTLRGMKGSCVMSPRQKRVSVFHRPPLFYVHFNYVQTCTNAPGLEESCQGSIES